MKYELIFLLMSNLINTQSDNTQSDNTQSDNTQSDNIELTESQYLIDIIGGCYAVFESNGTFTQCVQIEPYCELTKKILAFRATQDLTVLSVEDLQRVASWYLDELIKIKPYLCADIAVCRTPTDDHKLHVMFLAACENDKIKIAKYVQANCSNWTTISGFLLACKHGNIDIVRWLDMSYNPSIRQEGLIRACAHGHLDLAKWLYVSGTLVDSTCMSVACYNGECEVIDWMINEIKVEINRSDCDLLTTACCRGHKNIVELLITYGVDIHARGDMAIYLACRHDNLSIAQLLYTHGANPLYAIREAPFNLENLPPRIQQWINTLEM
jgi:Ankyrin repeats (3 copies)